MRIGISTNVPALREGLEVLLHDCAETESEWTFIDPSHAEGRCDVILLAQYGNLVTAGTNALALREQQPPPKPPVVIMTDQGGLRPFTLFTLFRVDGIRGVIAFDATRKVIQTALAAATTGNHFVDPTVGSFSFLETTRPWRPPTKREMGVFALLASGATVKDIANALNLSVKTVEAHKCNLMRKLGVHNKAQLTREAIQNGIVAIIQMEAAIRQ